MVLFRILTAVLLFSSGMAHAEPAWLQQGERRWPIDVRLSNDISYVRVSSLSQIFGFQYNFDEVRRKLTIIRKPHLIQMVEGLRWLLVDGKVIFMEGPLEIFQGHPEVPKTFLDRALTLMSGNAVRLETLEKELQTQEVDHSEEEAFLRPITTVVLDPGHGGKEDPGTQYGKLSEKDITLAVALQVKEQLEKRLPQMKVFLTRDKDQRVTLQERSQVPVAVKADLFLSIHINSSPIPTARGIETYFLGVEASDESARKTAELENKAFLKDKTHSSQTEIQQWLQELRQVEGLSESSLLAEVMQETIAESLTKSKKSKVTVSRGVKQAMFYVLMGSQIPAILVELGFLTHAHERNLLRQEQHLKKLSLALTDGIVNFHQNRQSRIQRLSGKKGP